jgi:nucleotide-binding universal stress UspA family protein
MIRKILIPSDGSALAEPAIRSGIELAKATGASVIGLAVAEPYPLRLYGELMVAGIEPLQHYRGESRESAQRMLVPLAQAAHAAGVDFHESAVYARSLADAVITAADEQACDLICIAADDHRRLTGVHLGRETARVLTRARVPVLVCH